MAEENGHPPGLMALLSRLAQTGVEVLRNRGELIAVELQEEKSRLAEILFLGGIMLFAGFLGAVLLTCLIIFLFPANLRLYATLGFAVLYFAAAVWAALALKTALQRAPFDESLRQLKKDRQWLESLK
jgi:uncharacterized membrane protein YqjE